MSALLALQKLKYERELREKEFPLNSLMILYHRSQKLLYVNYMEGFKELVNWLGPISRSKKQSINVPTYLYTYEVQEIAKILDEDGSKIWQELLQVMREQANPSTPF